MGADRRLIGRDRLRIVEDKKKIREDKGGSAADKRLIKTSLSMVRNFAFVPRTSHGSAPSAPVDLSSDGRLHFLFAG